MLSSKLVFPIGGGAAALSAAYLYNKSATSNALAIRKQALFAASPAAPGAAPGPFGNPAHQWDYYWKCMIGGILSCGLTHTAIVPMDVVKCRMQTQGEVYKSLATGFRLASKEGALILGWVPTFIGYSLQGCCKFGFYEIFKDFYASALGPDIAIPYRTFVYLAASASAEFIADVALCPFEAVKVRMQTSLPAAQFPTSFGPAWSKLTSVEGLGGLYKGIVPLWGRQVPYTMVKFACFEKTVEAFYTHVFTQPKESYAKTTQLGITFLSGYIAGVFCAVVSHPADTIVSKLNQSPEAGLGGIIAKIGFAGLWKGLMTRIVMIGTLTGLQWWIYDTFKTAVGLQTTGGVARK